MRFVLEKVNEKAIAENPPPDRVEIQMVSQSLKFAPKSVELAVGTATPRLSTFEAPKANQIQKKLVLIQARLKGPVNASDAAKAAPAFFDVGNLTVLVHPREVLFGLTESTVKAIQTLLSALGIPCDCPLRDYISSESL